MIGKRCGPVGSFRDGGDCSMAQPNIGLGRPRPDETQMGARREDRITMPKVTYIHPDGSADTVEVAPGTSVMQAAITNGIDGIVAECGGSAMCATCHVYVEPQFAALLPDMASAEDEMLGETASPRRPESRLGCQLPLSPALDGLVVRLPERQI